MAKVLDHTADLYIEGRGKTLGDAVVDVIRGMISESINSLPNPGKVVSLPKEEFCCIKASSEFKEEFVVSTIQKVIEYADINYVTIVDASLLNFSTNPYSIKISLTYVDYAPPQLIKAVTYHRLSILNEGDEWVVRVLFDI